MDFYLNIQSSLHAFFSTPHGITITYTRLTDPDLKLCGASIPVISDLKFLGLIFWKKLTFIKHIKYLKYRCMKPLKRITCGRPQGLGSGRATCSSCTILISVRSWIMVVLCTVQLGNQAWSLLTMYRMRRCALVWEHSERYIYRTYMYS